MAGCKTFASSTSNRKRIKDRNNVRLSIAPPYIKEVYCSVANLLYKIHYYTLNLKCNLRNSWQHLYLLTNHTWSFKADFLLEVEPVTCQTCQTPLLKGSSNLRNYAFCVWINPRNSLAALLNMKYVWISLEQSVSF